MTIDIETVLEIALQEFAKVIADASKNKGVSPNTVHFAPETAQTGLGQNARTTGGAGILPAAYCESFRPAGHKLTVLGVSPEVEEVEELPSGNYLVTLGYWSKDSKPNLNSFGDMPNKEAAHLALSDRSESPGKNDTIRDLLNPWRRRYKRVEIDPNKGKVVAIRMYEPALGVS